MKGALKTFTGFQDHQNVTEGSMVSPGFVRDPRQKSDAKKHWRTVSRTSGCNTLHAQWSTRVNSGAVRPSTKTQRNLVLPGKLRKSNTA